MAGDLTRLNLVLPNLEMPPQIRISRNIEKVGKRYVQNKKQ